jgi:hypothetical protein
MIFSVATHAGDVSLINSVHTLQQVHSTRAAARLQLQLQLHSGITALVTCLMAACEERLRAVVHQGWSIEPLHIALCIVTTTSQLLSSAKHDS